MLNFTAAVPRYYFSACGLIGNKGPNQTTADNYYSEAENPPDVIIHDGIQEWIVPISGVYIIEAAGAAGTEACQTSDRYETPGGKGAVISSSYHLIKGESIYIIVGQMGYSSATNFGGAGGGASFVAKSNRSSKYTLTNVGRNVEPLLIAGGGGGSGDCNENTTAKAGLNGLCITNQIEGNGTTVQENASGGAGFAHDANKAQSFLNGGSGGFTNGTNGTSMGGFGGGGNALDAGGGGGGYKGGDSLLRADGSEGGTSFSSGYLISCSEGKNDGPGYVNIYFQQPIYCFQHTCLRSQLKLKYLSHVMIMVVFSKKN